VPRVVQGFVLEVDGQHLLITCQKCSKPFTADKSLPVSSIVAALVSFVAKHAAVPDEGGGPCP
jgi:hypothetical protein